ncbi:uncharacterized protein LOC134393620 [Elgaria multicarinata webbii]|uniref:uncharacterized protein LOC134393620 n=1 Tax=Elgaria multicarinata webbii TaxID=159646 RepID=UPI002FCD462F
MGSVLCSKEVSVGTTEGNEWSCVKATKKHDEKKEIQELTKEEATVAEAAKKGALEILQDALKKKDKVLMKVPEKVILEGEDRGAFWMERHAILTERLVKDLLAELEKVTFKKDITKIHYIAYVYPKDEKRTIYLCDYFWKSPKYLERTSQPGTLIHEVSHFLNFEDLTYEENTIYLGCKGSVIKYCTENGSAISLPFWASLSKAFWNANNIKFEFALTISHKGKFEDGKYSCCGETERYSVCAKSVPDQFHSCNVDEMWKTDIVLNKQLQEVQTPLPWMIRIIKDIIFLTKMAELMRNYNQKTTLSESPIQSTNETED